MRPPGSRRLSAWVLLAGLATYALADQGTPVVTFYDLLASTGLPILYDTSNSFAFAVDASVSVGKVVLFTKDGPIASAKPTPSTTTSTSTLTATPGSPTETTPLKIVTSSPDAATTETTATLEHTTPTATPATSPSPAQGSPILTNMSPPQPGGLPKQRNRAESIEGHFGLELNMAGESGRITVNATSLSEAYHGHALYFQVHWKQEDGQSGESYSRDFAFQRTDDPDAQSLVSNTGPAFPETTFASTALIATSVSTRTPATLTASAASTAEASTAPSTSISVGSVKKKNGGLSGGAIAGIVIGVIAAVAILAAALLLLLRRRRGRGRGHTPYRSPGSEQIGLQSGYVAAAAGEKDGIADASGSRFGNSAILAAHSPYSDDDALAGQERAVEASSPATAARAINLPDTVGPASAATTVATTTTTTTADTVTAVSSSKPAVSGQVAALIEENMTPEDVARLEAEELELDAAINAMQGRRLGPE